MDWQRAAPLGEVIQCTHGRNPSSWIPCQYDQSKNSKTSQGQAHIPQAQRVLTVVAVHHPEKLADTLAAIYHASFAELKEVHTPEGLVPILETIFGEMETKEILTKVDIEVVRIVVANQSDVFAVDK